MTFVNNCTVNTDVYQHVLVPYIKYAFMRLCLPPSSVVHVSKVCNSVPKLA